jgi:hypothetical protein
MRGYCRLLVDKGHSSSFSSTAKGRENKNRENAGKEERGER